jgi:predicted RNA binding protein YcfA (HicA-like mRNA interferase family)
MTAKELLKLLHKDGWYDVETQGSHIQLKHSIKKEKVTVPSHKGDMPIGTVNSVLKQAGLK